MIGSRLVLLKQSGERLTDDLSKIWTPAAVRASAEKLGTLSYKRTELEIGGLAVVTGAGNIIRGKELREHGIGGDYADVLGRLATVQNTLVLAAALKHLAVPNKVFLSQNMTFEDPTIGNLKKWSEEDALDAMSEGAMVLIAGGTGEDRVTTDNAVVSYAASLKGSVDTVESLDYTVEILKGTQFDGVFDDDPRHNAAARRYSVISAQAMLADYDRFSAVDQASLERLVATGMSMRVFADGQHDLVHVLHPSNVNGTSVGTLISGVDTEPRFAN